MSIEDIGATASPPEPATKKAKSEKGALAELLRLFTPTELAQMQGQARRWLKNPTDFEDDMRLWWLVTLQITKMIAHGEIVQPVKGWAGIQYRALEALPDLIDTALETVMGSTKKGASK